MKLNILVDWLLKQKLYKPSFMLYPFLKTSQENVEQLYKEEVQKGPLEVMSSIIDSPGFYFTMSSVDRVSFNPRSSFHTPLGLYSYQLSEKNFKQLISHSLPFRRSAKYVHVFYSSPEHTLFLSKYTQADLDRDIGFLRQIFKDMADDDFKRVVNNAKREAFKQIPAGYLWNITRMFARHYPGKHMVAWGKLLFDLGYYTISDDGCQQIIHTAEPCQAVSFVQYHQPTGKISHEVKQNLFSLYNPNFDVGDEYQQPYIQSFDDAGRAEYAKQKKIYDDNVTLEKKIKKQNKKDRDVTIKYIESIIDSKDSGKDVSSIKKPSFDAVLKYVYKTSDGINTDKLSILASEYPSLSKDLMNKIINGSPGKFFRDNLDEKYPQYIEEALTALLTVEGGLSVLIVYENKEYLGMFPEFERGLINAIGAELSHNNTSNQAYIDKFFQSGLVTKDLSEKLSNDYLFGNSANSYVRQLIDRFGWTDEYPMKVGELLYNALIEGKRTVEYNQFISSNDLFEILNLVEYAKSKIPELGKYATYKDMPIITGNPINDLLTENPGLILRVFEIEPGKYYEEAQDAIANFDFVENENIVYSLISRPSHEVFVRIYNEIKKYPEPLQRALPLMANRVLTPEVERMIMEAYDLLKDAYPDIGKELISTSKDFNLDFYIDVFKRNSNDRGLLRLLLERTNFREWYLKNKPPLSKEEADKWKIGTKVEIIGGYWHSYKGEITSLSGYPESITVKINDEIEKEISLEHLKIVNNEVATVESSDLIAVGDSVRVSDIDKSYGGSTGIVKSIKEMHNGDIAYVALHDNGNGKKGIVSFWVRNLIKIISFKPGDYVKKGSKYGTILSILEHDQAARVEEHDYNEIHVWSFKDMIHVKHKGLKNGDKVKIIGGGSYYESKLGTIVDDTNKNRFFVTFEEHGNEKFRFFEEEVEKINIEDITFNVGDKVKVLQSIKGFNGSIGTISKISPKNIQVYFGEQNIMEYTFFAHELQKVSDDSILKPGDKVKVNANSSSFNGQVGTIKSLHNSHDNVGFMLYFGNDPDDLFKFNEDELEKIELSLIYDGVQYNIGDKVKVTTGAYYGEIGEVSGFDESLSQVKLLLGKEKAEFLFEMWAVEKVKDEGPITNKPIFSIGDHVVADNKPELAGVVSKIYYDHSLEETVVQIDGNFNSSFSIILGNVKLTGFNIGDKVTVNDPDVSLNGMKGTITGFKGTEVNVEFLAFGKSIHKTYKYTSLINLSADIADNDKHIFGVGDKVKIIDGEYKGLIGVIKEHNPTSPAYPYEITLKGLKYAEPFNANEFELITKAEKVINEITELKFKVGDKIKFIAEKDSPYYGKTGIIDKVKTLGQVYPYNIIIDGETEITPVKEHEIELITESNKHKFKIGDKVNIISNETDNHHDGATGVIKQLNSENLYPYHVSIDGKEGNAVPMLESELSLIEKSNEESKPEQKFKIGDKVKLINMGEDSYLKGATGVIVDIDESANYPYFVLIDTFKDKIPVSANEIELIEDAKPEAKPEVKDKFKIGDKVKVLSNSPYKSHAGKEGIISNINKIFITSPYEVKINNEEYDIAFAENELELVGNQFKINDVVKISKDGPWKGWTGKAIQIDDDYVTVDFKNSGKQVYWFKYLTLVSSAPDVAQTSTPDMPITNKTLTNTTTPITDKSLYNYTIFKINDLVQINEPHFLAGTNGFVHSVSGTDVEVSYNAKTNDGSISNVKTHINEKFLSIIEEAATHHEDQYYDDPGYDDDW